MKRTFKFFFYFLNFKCVGIFSEKLYQENGKKEKSNCCNKKKNRIRATRMKKQGKLGRFEKRLHAKIRKKGRENSRKIIKNNNFIFFQKRT